MNLKSLSLFAVEAHLQQYHVKWKTWIKSVSSSSAFLQDLTQYLLDTVYWPNYWTLLSSIQLKHTHFLLKTSTDMAFNFLQRCRQLPRTKKERDKHLPLRKQDVPTQTSGLRKLWFPNIINFFPKHNMWQSEVKGPPKTVSLFWSSTHLSLSCHFRSRSGSKVNMLSFNSFIRWERSCFDQ